MYSLFSDKRGTDAMIDWQFKIMDYITDQLENAPDGVAFKFTKKSFIRMCALMIFAGLLLVLGIFGLYVVF